MSHTPGPWKGDRLDGTLKYSVTGSNGELVLAVQHKSFEYGFIGPNAKDDELLVLAAPDLLKELKSLTESHERQWREFGVVPGWLKSARDAIAKAEGK